MSDPSPSQHIAGFSGPLRGRKKPDLQSAGTTGSLVDSGNRPSEQFGAGRTCKEPGCETVLSIYNSSDKCATHPNNAVRLNRINGGGGFDHVLLKKLHNLRAVLEEDSEQK